jgi:alpha-1,4-digalacturonate transport system substrate-binding protein
MCYSDGNECEVYDDVLDRFEAENEGIDVVVDVVPYQAILENLPVQLAAGTGPDIAKVTDLGGLNEYYLDLTPYVDAAYWEAASAARSTGIAAVTDQGIYGMHSQLTITGAFVNATLFEQAGIECRARMRPGKTGPRPPAPWPRPPTRPSRWRSTAPATASRVPRSPTGRSSFDADGNALRRASPPSWQQFVAWHEDGTIARDVWAGQGGATYQDAAQEFINGELVFYYSGSWQVGRMDEQVGDFFDWQVVGSPCGPAGACSGMPGGAGIVGFEQTEHPEAVAAVIDFLAQEDIYAEVAARTRNLPAHLGVASAGVEFQDASPAAPPR